MLPLPSIDEGHQHSSRGVEHLPTYILHIPAAAAMAVTLHTSLGDIKLELYCDLVPRTCEVRVLLLCVGGAAAFG